MWFIKNNYENFFLNIQVDDEDYYLFYFMVVDDIFVVLLLMDDELLKEECNGKKQIGLVDY